jgi:hypothetical protein
MHDDIDWARDLDISGDIVPRESETGIPQQVGNIGLRASDKIVEREDVPALVYEEIAEMRAKKARSACYDDAQSFARFPAGPTRVQRLKPSLLYPVVALDKLARSAKC